MIKVNELRITNDEKLLIIDVAVQDLKYFDNCLIKSIQIDTQDKYLKPESYKGPVYKYEFWSYSEVENKLQETINTIMKGTKDLKYDFTKDGIVDTQDINYALRNFKTDEYNKRRHVRLELDGTEPWSIDPDFKNTLFFVTITAEGTPASDTPCALQDNVLVMPVFSMCEVYKYFLSGIKEVERVCEVPKDFIDTLLRYKALEVYSNVRDWYKVAVYWQRYIKGISVKSVSSKCGCYG